MSFRDATVTVANEAGSFFKAEIGTYKGEFVGLADGPTFTYDGKETPHVEWSWRLFKLDGSPVIDPETGDGAVLNALTSTILSTKSKSYEWFTAHGVEPQVGESWGELEEKIKGKEVIISVGPGKNDPTKTRVMAVSRFSS